MQEHFNVEFDEYEIQNITIQLICKRSTKGLTFIKDLNIINLQNEILDKIKEKTLITFNDEHFNKVFPLYLKYTLIRQKYGEKYVHHFTKIFNTIILWHIILHKLFLKQLKNIQKQEFLEVK